MMVFLKFSCAEDSTDAAKRLPTCTPSAPNTIAASIPRPVAIPPAPIKGISICSLTIGIKVRVVVSSLPLCPPASKPSATTASTPACCAFKAKTELLTTCTTVIPFSFKKGVHVLGFPADVKTILTPSSTIIFMISSMFGYNIGTLTPKGLVVAFLHF
ncbi:hypothetical protein D3C86_585820 [compost metagenome]